MTSCAEVRLAYLTSQYPATSHTFIGREVSALRDLGVHLDTFSIRAPSEAEQRDETIRGETSTTFTVLARPANELIGAHLRLLLSRPATYCRIFVLALRHRAPGLKALALSIAHFAEAVLLARELKRRGITHLHNHFANSAATVGYLATRLLGLPWSFTMHGISETDYPAGLLLARKIEAADFVACVSYFGRAQAMRLTRPSQWSKMHIIRCGLPLQSLSPMAPAQRSNQIICVARLSPEKGHAGLLEAFSTIALELPDLELLLVGDGPASTELRAIVNKLSLTHRVKFAGALSEMDTIKEIARSAMLVLPSFMEGLPIVLMEAMAVGTPVIASRVAGIPELVEDGETGLLFTPSKWEELASSILRLAGDKDLRARLTAAGRRRVQREFDGHGSAEQLLDLFRRRDTAPARSTGSPST